MDETLKYKSPWDEEAIDLSLTVDSFGSTNNISIGLTSIEDGCEELFAELTVDFNEEVLPAYHGYLDIGGNLEGIEELVEENGLGERTGKVKQSGFDSYPLYKFNEEKLKELDPKGIEAYENSLEQMRKSLNRKER